MMLNKFTRLISGNITGCIDAYDAVHSVFSDEDLPTHADLFTTTHFLWRWNWNQSIWYSVYNDISPTLEQLDAIERHLERVYGIKFWENGHHDIDYIQEQIKKESKTVDLIK